MAQTECLQKMQVDVETEAMKTEDFPPMKKLKQGRLPFKPLDHAGQSLSGNTPPGSKKRKLSDNESPSAKQLKTCPAPTSSKPLIQDGEPEVSSSSEADIVKDHLQFKQGKKLNTIDKFFKAKSAVQDQEEISSTNECIEIDLSDEGGEDKDTVVAEGKCKISSQESVGENKTNENVESGIVSVVENEEHAKAKEETKNDEEKENEVEEVQIDGDADQSFIADTSVCEDALKTPAKGAKAESVLKTPVCSSKTDSMSTPSQSQGSASDTPVSSIKKKKPLSASKLKEREELRNKIKEQKEKEKEERRLQKEKEKEEKRQELLEKKRQKEEQREKEKAEKERAKQEEKEKKEKERLEKLKQKEEEKKQKEKEMEVKMEEKRKKEEERKQKEEEKRQKEEEKRKEEEEKQRKEEKKKEMFKGFFIKKDVTPPKTKETKNGLFMPFELKVNMKLAPQYRRIPLNEEGREEFDEEFKKQDCSKLYLDALKSNTFRRGRSDKTWPRALDEDNDVELLSHEKETIEKVTHHVKFLKFHENTRPPYYGTWRKSSKILTARNPFKQDESLFDYEIDSDDEWEEEEPGESVSSDEEEDETEKVDDEDLEADEWMVPHGYLSDGEGVDDDEEVDHASKQDLQKVRQAAWESELKRQAKPLKMISIGCIWDNNDTTTIAAQQLETLLKYKAVFLMEGPIGTTFTGTRVSEVDVGSGKSDKGDEKPLKNSNQRKSVPEEAIPDLIRLVHGNPIGIKNLIKEFRMYWKKKTNPSDDASNTTLDSSKLDMSMEVDDNTDKTSVPETTKNDTVDTPKASNENNKESEHEFAISKRQLEMKIPAIAVREKRAEHKKTCWYVKDEVLQQYNMTDIKLPNSWEYVCVKEPTWAQDKTPAAKVDESSSGRLSAGGRATPNIMQFAQPMSPSQIQALGPVAGSKDGTPNKNAEAQIAVQGTADLEPSLTPSKPSVPADQRRIKDMFSPAARKAISIPASKNESPKLVRVSTTASEQTITNLSPAAKKAINNLIVVNTASPKQSHINSTNDQPAKLKEEETTPSKATSGSEGNGSVTKLTPKAARHPVLQNMLSSPELMKASAPSNNVTKESEEDKEQPMDVDIIVLD